MVKSKSIDANQKIVWWKNLIILQYSYKIMGSMKVKYKEHNWIWMEINGKKVPEKLKQNSQAI